MDRSPVVAGQFYPGHSSELEQMVAGFLPEEEKESALAVVSPHAGYIFSGSIAGSTFARVKVPKKILILGPNHHGLGHPAAVYPDGNWETPLGKTPIDTDLAARVLEQCPGATADEQAHSHEHSLEVQLPFVQYLNPQARIVPICLGHVPLDRLLQMGEAIGGIIASDREEILMVASTDMTHYESGEQARDKDMDAIERILDLDPEGLYSTVRERGITMCGVIPTVVMLAAARRLGASEARLVHYGNSGDVTGDQSQVVGYAGLIIR